MRKLRALGKRLCATFVRRHLDGDFEDELEAHVALDTERGVRKVRFQLRLRHCPARCGDLRYRAGSPGLRGSRRLLVSRAPRSFNQPDGGLADRVGDS